MRVVLQRVSLASVRVDGKEISRIGRGYLLLACVMDGDRETDVDSVAEKVAGLRLWDGVEGKINDRSLVDIGGAALVVSQFTLAGDTKKGRRPDYTAAAKPEIAKPLVERFAQALKKQGIATVEQGLFGAHMAVELANDGPVTLLLDSRKDA